MGKGIGNMADIDSHMGNEEEDMKLRRRRRWEEDRGGEAVAAENQWTRTVF